MKHLPIIAILMLSFGAHAQEGVLKSVGNAAKGKVEAQDFNTSRSNKDKSRLSNEAPAPAASPTTPPAPGTPAKPADTTAAKPVIVRSGNKAYQAEYVFDKTLTYENTNPKKPDQAAEIVTYSYSNGALMTHLSGSPTVTVLTDFENEVAINFDEKNKTAMVTSTKWITNMAAKMASDNPVTVTKTGNKKVVLGYNCEEYIIDDGKNKTNCWITTEVKMDYAKTVAALTKNVSVKTNGSDLPAECLLVELTSYNKKGEANSHMVLTNYAPGKTTRKLSEYKVTAL